MKFTGDKIIKILKWLALISLPAIGVLYFTLAKIWGLPYGSEVMATAEALALFLGVIIGVKKPTPDDDEVFQSTDTFLDELEDDLTEND